MSKYTPLKKFLENKGISNVPMAFAEIEAIIEAALPPSARKYRAWWSNNPSNSVITYAWLRAGYKTSAVDLAREKLVFIRLNTNDAHFPLVKSAQGHQTRGFLGGMKGTVTIADGYDLTSPLDVAWDAQIQ